VKKFVSILVVIFCLLILSESVDAQCAMCKLNAENASEADQDIGRGLNTGILYLMGIPYALLMTLGIVFFREKIFTFIKR
jgi:hypothetical protein